MVRACIHGAGAIGLDLAVALLEAGVAVSLVARGSNLAALRATGLMHRTRDGPTHTIPSARFRCAARAAELGEQDLVFITTKSDAFAEVAATIAPLLSPSTVVVTAMNGLPPWFGLGRPTLAERLRPVHRPSLGAISPDQIVGAVIHRNAARVEPGLVERIAGTGLVVGELDGRHTLRLARLAGVVEGTSYALEPSISIYAAVWHKLLINATINPLSVLCEQALDVMVTEPKIAERLRILIAEVEALGIRLGVVEPDSFDVDGLFERFARRRRGAITSMLRDYRSQRPLELERLVRAPLRLAGSPGVAVPMPALAQLLQEVEAKLC